MSNRSLEGSFNILAFIAGSMTVMLWIASKGKERLKKETNERVR